MIISFGVFEPSALEPSSEPYPAVRLLQAVGIIDAVKVVDEVLQIAGLHLARG